MRKIIMAAVAASLTIPATMVLPAAEAAASPAQKRHKYREWRGRDGRTYCRKSDGTTGLIVGGVAGTLVGRSIDTGGDRTAGTLLGAAGGALLGREVERSRDKRRCR